MAEKITISVGDDDEAEPMTPEAIEPPKRQDYELEAKPSWKNRRRVIFWSLILCAATWAWILVGMPIWGFEIAESIAETALTMSGFLAGSVIGGYVFGATWESVGMSKK